MYPAVKGYAIGVNPAGDAGEWEVGTNPHQYFGWWGHHHHHHHVSFIA